MTVLLLSSVPPSHFVPVQVAFQKLKRLLVGQQRMVVPVKVVVWLFLGDYTESFNLKCKRNEKEVTYRATCAQDNFEVAGVLEACLGAAACVAVFPLASVVCPHVEVIELPETVAVVVGFSGCEGESVHSGVEGVKPFCCSCDSLEILLGASGLPSAQSEGEPLVTAPE